ncbi:tripartite tricarboxylate transporter permease [Lonepinella koalarum]|uniref:Putative tricarboxylic transport membrane protein n=1 Tax=Lonepinella koalarum TaxID=53417 RepID=A0A4R1KYP6_9PAST|nr:tripartite tricarboxylate transporter permease [Lonepinella koalarum]MDH2926694.1 C4-dicarboxylate ABC transporter permease [Lonepinella koalarum]TCK70645.1 putative tricarboxylic transport membrane protein [Lonepinella koalarum]TFJ89975.1 tripartite tricarboxylate transporter permease [Lonepinella koalarum]
MWDLMVSGFGEFFNWGSFLWINLGLFLGIVFGSIPGLTVMLCLVLFLPITYSLGAIHSFMFLLGIYCAGSYGGSISAILIKTPGTPHAAATMLDGHPLATHGQAQKALNIALYASFIGGIVSALVLLFLAPEVASVAMKMGSPEYFLICAFGLTIIAGVSGESLLKGIISGCLGLFLSFIGMDLISGSTMRFAFDNINLYSGFDLVVVLIGLFALIEIINKGSTLKPAHTENVMSKSLDKGRLQKGEWGRLIKPMGIGSLSGILVGIIPGTGASIASFLSYDTSRKVSKKPEEFGHGSIEGIAAAESANNAITGTALIPLLTLGIPGDAAVALMLGALMINGLTPGPNLFETHGSSVYAIMIGLLFVNLFMLLQGKYLLRFFAKVVKIPQEILIPIIAVFCFAGAYSLKESMFDVGTTIVFGLIAYLMEKLGFSAVPTLLGMVLGALTEKNFRRSLMISDGNWDIFINRPFSLVFCILIGLVILSIIWNNTKKVRSKNV